MQWNIVVVGCGGTGSAFLQKLARFQYSAEENINVTIIDGDIVEEKNLKRQNFFEANVNYPKAESIVKLAANSYGLEWRCLNEYLLNVSQLDSVFKSLANNSSVEILVGCVDNHRARQVMEEWFSSIRNGFYIDSANDESDGEVVVAVKTNGLEISPSRAYYYPDVLTDSSPSVVELSCEAMNISSPQHQLVNDLAGNILMNVICKIFNRNIPTGQIIFDCKTNMVKHLSYINGQLKV